MSFVISLSSERHTISVRQYEEENSINQQSVSENSENGSNSGNDNTDSKSYHNVSSFNTGMVISLEDTEDIY